MIKGNKLASKEPKNKELNRISAFELENNEYSVLSELLETQVSMEKGFFDKHEASEGIRRRMVDWMVEVFCNYKCSHASFFKAVSLMDGFLEATDKNVMEGDIHLLGAGCMFLASKYEEIVGVGLKEMLNEVCHGCFEVVELLYIEDLILNTVDLSLFCRPTPLQFINAFLFDFINSNSEEWNQISDKETIREFANTSYIFAMISCMFPRFSSVECNIIAVVSIVCASDQLRTVLAEGDLVALELANFAKTVVGSIENQSEEYVKTVYSDLRKAFIDYKSNKNLKHNLLNESYKFLPTELAIFY